MLLLPDVRSSESAPVASFPSLFNGSCGRRRQKRPRLEAAWTLAGFPVLFRFLPPKSDLKWRAFDSESEMQSEDGRWQQASTALTETKNRCVGGLFFSYIVDISVLILLEGPKSTPCFTLKLIVCIILLRSSTWLIYSEHLPHNVHYCLI